MDITRCAVVLLIVSPAAGDFAVYQGGVDAEAAWLAAAGAAALETFESYTGTMTTEPTGDPICRLEPLGVRFETDLPGVCPGVYDDVRWAHSGSKQLANFAAGAGQYSDFRVRPVKGRELYALSFWQCDPQGDQEMRAYDAAGQLVGTIVGRINDGSGMSFAGFVSSVPIAWVEVPGGAGDGWNHIDDVRASTASACAADFDGSGTLTLADFVAFRNAYVGGDLRADFDGSGTLTLNDFVQFRNTYVAGCP